MGTFGEKFVHDSDLRYSKNIKFQGELKDVLFLREESLPISKVSFKNIVIYRPFLQQQ